MSSDPAPADPGTRWMLRYQGGEEGAFDRIVEHYSGNLFSLLTRFLGPVPQREDLVQEVFLRVIRARERHEPTARFSTWLYRIAFNLCANERERRRTSSSIEVEGGEERRSAGWEDEAAESPSLAIEREDTQAMVQRAIAELPERQRMALILAKFEDCSYAEIARTLETSEKAIKSMIHRARENLRAALAPLFEEQEK